MTTIISAFDIVDSRWYLRFKLLFMVYFSIWASKTLQKSSAIQKISVTLSSVIIAIIVCKLLIFSTLKLQQFSLITKFSDTYISSNSRYIRNAKRRRRHERKRCSHASHQARGIFQYSSSSNIPNRGMKLRTCLLGVI